MKVALSASFFTCPAVNEMLTQCDVVYTTNVAARDMLYEHLGSWRVRFLPANTPEFTQFLVEKHRGANDEIVQYPDIKAVWENWIVNQATDEQLCEWFNYFGYKPVEGGWRRNQSAPIPSEQVCRNIRQQLTPKS
jgi:hypothetical protein